MSDFAKDTDVLVNDCIRRQAVIDAIYALSDNTIAWLDAAAESVKKLPSAQQWIPVSERLPEKNGRYLVTCEQWGAWEVDWNIWYTTPRPGWLWEKGITAWMPLPEPWRGEGG